MQRSQLSTPNERIPPYGSSACLSRPLLIHKLSKQLILTYEYLITSARPLGHSLAAVLVWFVDTGGYIAPSQIRYCCYFHFTKNLRNPLSPHLSSSNGSRLASNRHAPLATQFFFLKKEQKPNTETPRYIYIYIRICSGALQGVHSGQFQWCIYPIWWQGKNCRVGHAEAASVSGEPREITRLRGKTGLDKAFSSRAWSTI